MQVTSLFATFIGFLLLVAPLATQALQIITPTNITTGNATIAFTSEDTDSSTLLTFSIVKNATHYTIAQGVGPAAGSVFVTIPANVTGAGWIIQASSSDGSVQAVSLPFSIAAVSPPPHGGPSMAGAIIGGVAAGVIALGLIVFSVVFYTRRRQHQRTAPAFNLESGFLPRQQHTRSFSSMSSGLGKTESDTLDTGNKALEMEKMQWEMELEEQFARARAGTPDVQRGASPMPLAPQRAVTRNTNY